MRMLTRSTVFFILVATTFQTQGSPANAGNSKSQSSAIQTVKLPWLANLTEAEFKKYNGILKTDTKFEHPTFSLLASKGWMYSTSGPALHFEETLTLIDNHILINFFLDHRNRLGLEGFKKEFQITSLTDATLGNKTLKMATTKAGRFYFYSTKNYELIINVSSPEKPSQAQLNAEKSLLDSVIVH